MAARSHGGLQQHLRQVQLITSNSSEGVIMIDVNQEIKWANAAALAMHAVPSYASLGRTIDEYHANFQVKFRGTPTAAVEQSIESVAAGESFRDVVIEVTPLNGDQPLWIYRVRNLVLVDQAGSPTCVVLVLRRLDDQVAGKGQFQVSVDAMPIASAVIRLHDSRFVEVNHQFSNLTGFDKSALAGTGIGAADLWRQCEDPHIKRLEDVRQATSVATVLKSGDTSKNVVISSAPVSLDGHPAVLLSIIDTAQAAESATDHSQSGAENAQIAALCHLAPTALHALDENMRVQGVSQAWLDWLGYPREAVIGRSVSEFMSPASATHFQTHTWDMLSHAGTVRDLDVSFVTNAGETVQAAVSARATLDDEGAPRLVMAAAIDITEQKRSEAAFNALFALSPLPMLVRKLDDPRILDVNDAFTAATGRHSEAIVGHSVDELGMFESRAMRQHFENAVRTTSRVQNLEVRLKAGGGEVLDCLLSAEQIHAFGQSCVLMILQDVSDRRRNEMELFEAIEKVMGDTSWFSRSVIEKLASLRSPPRSGARSAEIGDLTPREREVLGLISHGMADADIAAKLGLTRSTVRNHVATLYSKIGVHSRSSAIIWARERGINFAWPAAGAANMLRGPIVHGKSAGSALGAKSRRA
jgi:PAS domain S-box-containing protein